MYEFAQTVRCMRQRGELFSPRSPIHIGRAPGRLDLMGGNDDYTGGLVFEATIREATWAAVQLREDHRIVLINPQMRERGWRDRVEFLLPELTTDENLRTLVNRDPATKWTAYVLGNFYYLRKNHPDRVRSGANVYIQSDV